MDETQVTLIADYYLLIAYYDYEMYSFS